jgi:hypothetical protein
MVPRIIERIRIKKLRKKHINKHTKMQIEIKEIMLKMIYPKSLSI